MGKVRGEDKFGVFRKLYTTNLYIENRSSMKTYSILQTYSVLCFAEYSLVTFMGTEAEEHVYV